MRVPSPSYDFSRRRSLWNSLLALLVVIATVACESKASMQAKVQASLEASKQQWFDQFHPVGKAKSITVHAVEPVKTADGAQTIARFTIYWEGPIKKDGFTKVRAVHDEESNRWVRAEILETNGITTAQTVNGIGAAVVGFLAH